MTKREAARILKREPTHPEALARLDANSRHPHAKPPPIRRLSKLELGLVLQMAAAGKDVAHIALGLSLKPGTIKAVLTRYADTSIEALALLRAKAVDAAINWSKSQTAAVKNGNHKPMRDHLAAIGVIKETPTIGQQIVIVGMGGAPIGEDPFAPPVIEGTVVPARSSKDATADQVLEGLLAE